MRLRTLFEDLDDRDEFGRDCGYCYDHQRTAGPDFHEVHIGARDAGTQAYWQTELGKLYTKWNAEHGGDEDWDGFIKGYYLLLPTKEQDRLSTVATLAQRKAETDFYAQHGYTYEGGWGGNWIKH